jgi:two-component system, LytTR family, response regulator
VKALIVDDERLARVELRRLLSAHPEVEVAGEAASGAEALDIIGSTPLDLLFLDIQMPDMSGFDLLDHLADHIPQVVFTTAYDRHAIRAFEVNALDYLLKPIAPERLAVALSRVSTTRGAPLLSQVFVRDGDRCWIVRLTDISLFESEGNYARVYFGIERPLIRRSLHALEQQLDPGTFFRANRQQIVNLTCVESTRIGATGTLIALLRGGTAVELSRRQSDRFRERFSL